MNRLTDRIEELLKDPSLSADLAKEYAGIAAQVDNFNSQELGAQLTRFEVVSPNGFPISAPEAFNLMFPTQV